MNDWEQFQTKIGYGLLLCLGLFIVPLVQTVCLNVYFQRCYRAGMHVRAGIMTAVYNKSLRLSTGSRQRTTVGEIVNLMSTYLCGLCCDVGCVWRMCNMIVCRGVGCGCDVACMYVCWYMQVCSSSPSVLFSRICVFMCVCVCVFDSVLSLSLLTFFFFFFFFIVFLSPARHRRQPPQEHVDLPARSVVLSIADLFLALLSLSAVRCCGVRRRHCAGAHDPGERTAGACAVQVPDPVHVGQGQPCTSDERDSAGHSCAQILLVGGELP
jgi:ABC transporter transmembrane region